MMVTRPPDRFRPPLIARDFIEALVTAGVLPADRRVRRVVIDAKYGPYLVVMHVEMLGDPSLLSVVSTLGGVHISREES